MDALKLEHSLTDLKIVKHLTRTPPPPRHSDARRFVFRQPA